MLVQLCHPTPGSASTVLSVCGEGLGRDDDDDLSVLMCLVASWLLAHCRIIQLQDEVNSDE